MIERKVIHIKANPMLDSIVNNSQSYHLGTSYNLIGCDLRHREVLQWNLVECGIDNSAPTLFIAECILTYVDVER